VLSADVSDKADNVSPSKSPTRKESSSRPRPIKCMRNSHTRRKPKQKYTSNKIFVNSSATNTNRHGYRTLCILHSTTILSVHSSAKGRHIQLQVLCPGRQRSGAMQPDATHPNPKRFRLYNPIPARQPTNLLTTIA